MENEVLIKLRNFKASQESNIGDEQEEILDITYYGKINLDKESQDLYLVEKQVGKQKVQQFCTNTGIIATVGINNEITINKEYEEQISNNEFILQLQDTMPISLKKLEQLQKGKDTSSKPQETNEKIQETKKDTKTEEKEHYIENPKDAIIDLNKKITETKTFAELVPEVKDKQIVDVRVRRIDNTRFEFIGINENQEVIKLNSLQQTEGTNPNQDIVKVNQDGSKVQKEEVMTILKLQNGQNEQKGNEGFSITLDKYGTPEVSYYRRAPENDEYTSIPVNLKNTNQKRTELEVREYMEKKRNVTIEDNVKRANNELKKDKSAQTVLEDIDDNPYNDTENSEEHLIAEAAKRCKVTIKAFKEELGKANGDTLQERIESAEEEINEQYIVNNQRI